MTTTVGLDSVDVAVQEIADLFVPPTPDPLNGRFETKSGVERMRDVVHPTGPVLRIEVRVASREGASVDADQVQAALRGYCLEEIEQLDVERTKVRRLGMKELRFGLALLAVCFALSATVSAVGVTPEWFRQFLAEGLVIIGWIALWHPVDMLFFDRLPIARDQRILRRIHDGDVVVTSG